MDRCHCFTFIFIKRLIILNLFADQRDSHRRVINYYKMFKLEEMYASVLYKVREDRRKLRETVKRLFLASNPSEDKERVFRDILHEEINIV